MPPPGGAPLRCAGPSADINHLQIGLGIGEFNTTLDFDNGRDVAVEMTTVSVAGAWLMNERWTTRVGVGLIADGRLGTADGTWYDVESGGLVTVGAEYRAHQGTGQTPSVDLSFFLGASWAEIVAPVSSEQTDYFAADARLGARAGWSVGDHLYPYFAARIFGGPVHWELADEDVVGSDVHHYQVALGAAGQIGAMGLFVEWAQLGEKALGGGVSWVW